MVSLGSKLKSLRKDRGLTLDELASELNQNSTGTRYSKGKISAWENNRQEPVLSSLQDVATYFGVGLDYFMDSTPKIVKLTSHETDKLIRVPVIGNIKSKESIEDDKNILNYHIEYFPSKIPSEEIFDVILADHSMDPLIPKGALVCIQKQSNVNDGELAAVLLDDKDEISIFRVRKFKKVVFLVPENSEYPPIFFDEKHPCRILGKAIHYTKDL